MFTVYVDTRFRASHCLSFPDGSKEPLHRHKWGVTAEISGNKLNEMGLLIDFGLVKKALDEVVSVFENGTLEAIAHFKRNNSSAENVAQYIFEQLAARLSRLVRRGGRVQLESVMVCEEAGCSAKYTNTPFTPEAGDKFH